LILILFGRAAQFMLLLLTMRLATEFLSPEQMGRLALVTATTAFFALFLVSPVGMFINRRLHAWDASGRARRYLEWHWIYLLIVSLIAAACLAAVNAFQAFDFQFQTVWLLVLVCGSLMFNTINQTAIPSLNLLEFRGLFIALTLITIGLSLVASMILVHIFVPTAEFWLLGLLTGQIVVGLIGVRVFFSKLQPSAVTSAPNWENLRQLLKFAWPIAIAVGLNWLQTQGYRFYAAESLGLAALGLFVAGYGISAGLTAAFESVLTTYFQPQFYKAVSNGDLDDQRAAWNNYAAAILPSLMLAMFSVSALAPELTRFMVGPNYQSASQYVIWGVLAEGARVIVSVYAMSAHARMRTQLLLWPNILGAAVSVAMLWVLVPLYGAQGVGAALSLAGGGVILAMHYPMVVSPAMSLAYLSVLKGAGLGLLLFLFVAGARLSIGGTDDLVNAGGLILAAGLLFLPMFYWLMRPYTKGN
jgi:O-antigen/teichoic acid export membrane protein